MKTIRSMMWRSVTVAVSGICGLNLALSATAQAHHSAAPHYDLSKTIAVTGVVNKFEFVNPHAYVYFINSDDSGKQAQWRCELSAKAFLVRMGWTQDTFKVGEKITFKGSPARREDNVCVLDSFVRADGTEINTRSNLLTGERGKRTLTATSNNVAVAATTTTGIGAEGNDLSGYWVAQSEGPGGGMGARVKGGMSVGIRVRAAGGASMPMPSAAGKQAAQHYDQRFDDPAIKCSAGNIIFGWIHDQNVNAIEQNANSVTLTYGYMDLVRTIHLNQQHPSKITPSLAGHSIGHWETEDDASVLVVDTIGFKAGVLFPLGTGILHSDRLHIIERFTLSNDGNMLTRDYQVEDPLYLQSAYSGSDVMSRSQQPYTPYHCVELSGKNNQRS